MAWGGDAYRWAGPAVLVLCLMSCTGSGGDPKRDTDNDRAASPEAPTVEPDSTIRELRLSQPRAVHRATMMADGRVLFTGGCTEPGCGGFDAARRSEVYDGAGFVAGAQMVTPRASGTATLLADGRVLLTGGYPGEGQAPTASAEVYDPTSSSFASVGDLRTARADHSATLLPDGRVVLAGGFDAQARALTSTEVFDPQTDSFAPGAVLSAPRAAHVAVALGDAVVLVGGTERSAALAGTDMLIEGHWAAGPTLRTPRVKLGVVAVDAQRLLVVGGSTDTEGRDRLASSEVLDLREARTEPGPSMSNGEYKLDGALATLSDGRVVVASAGALEVYDTRTRTFARVPVRSGAARSFRTVTAVGPRTVLIVGGYDEQIVPTDSAVLVTLPPRGA